MYPKKRKGLCANILYNETRGSNENLSLFGGGEWLEERDGIGANNKLSGYYFLSSFCRQCCLTFMF